MFDGTFARLSRRLARFRALPMPLRRLLHQVARARPKTTHAFAPTAFVADHAGSLTPLIGFGSNPGALGALLYVPNPPPRPGAPLLVLLHGCGQDPVVFARDSGFCRLADRARAALLLPVQEEANNASRCFNWFRPGDHRRDVGEALSIRQMVDAAAQRCHSDRRRIYLAGLSAGGAMTAMMLAAYPDVFAAGAVVAGLPVGCANNIPSALLRMAKGGPSWRPAAWTDRVRGAGPAHYRGPWPRVMIWQGMADLTVNALNAESLVTQWVGINGLPAVPTEELAPRPGVRLRRWGDVVECWTIDGMDHGFPADRETEEQYVLDVGIDGAAEIGRFWGVG